VAAVAEDQLMPDLMADPMAAVAEDQLMPDLVADPMAVAAVYRL